MMALSSIWSLPSQEQDVARSTIAFVESRLADIATFEWVLTLAENQNAERLAVEEVLNHPSHQDLKEPWRSAWTWVVESWRQTPTEDRYDLSKFSCAERVRKGDRSGDLIFLIVELVRPFVTVRNREAWTFLKGKRPENPRRVEDFLSISLSSGDLLSPKELSLDLVREISFLTELADQLDAAVVAGINIARRFGWKEKRGLVWLGELYRVYVTPSDQRDEEGDEPDRYHHGIAPSVKLLFEIVMQIAGKDISCARPYVLRWLTRATPVHQRLWAAAARNPTIASPKEVGRFLRQCGAEEFWEPNSYPEIAELRALRFGALSISNQASVIGRIMKRPPINLWSKGMDRQRLDEARDYYTLRELQRIKVGGSQLPSSVSHWITEAVRRHPEILDMDRISFEFLEAPAARSVPPNPDDKFDALEGAELVASLEADLRSDEWQGPGDRARDWFQQPDRPRKALIALLSMEDHGALLPLVWRSIGWSHRPPKKEQEADLTHDTDLASQVLGLIPTLPTSTISSALHGLTSWLSAWRSNLKAISTLMDAVAALWPLAVAQANEKRKANSGESKAKEDRFARIRRDAIGNPVGDLLDAFLASRPSVKRGDRPFEQNRSLLAIRDMMVSADGYAGLLAKYRMVQSLAWFLFADPEWAKTALVSPLFQNTQESLALWHAMAHQSTISPEVMRLVGQSQAEKAADDRLPTVARKSLAHQVVLVALYDLWEKQELVLSKGSIQQMLRSVDDEVRAAAANTPKRFLEGALGKESERKVGTKPSQLFEGAIKPFLQEIWPLEQTLVTPGVASAFARLPAGCGSAFADAVNVVARLLVPFDCWTLSDYDLVEIQGDQRRFANVETPADAKALIILLDRTIGYDETARVPNDLGVALDHALAIDSSIGSDPFFQRLSALARKR